MVLMQGYSTNRTAHAVQMGSKGNGSKDQIQKTFHCFTSGPSLSMLLACVFSASRYLNTCKITAQLWIYCSKSCFCVSQRYALFLPLSVICTAYVEIGTCIACHMLHGSNKTLLLDCVVVPLLFHLYVIQLHNHHYSWVSNQSFWPVVNTKGKKAFGRGLLSCTSPGS